MTNPSAQTMLADELEDYSNKYQRGDDPWANAMPTFSWQQVDLIVTALRAASAPAAVREETVNELAAWLAALEDASMYEPVPNSLIEHGRVYIRAGLTEKHSGDCTNECHSCVVCGTSDYVAKAKQILAALATTEEASTAAVSRSRTEICMNEKCPRGQGVPVEIVTAPPAAQTDG